MADQAWYPDSGATTHITNDPTKITKCSLYAGSGVVTVGNGHRIAISHTSSTLLSTGSGELLLHDLLFVPDIHKNLLSVSKFTKDNKVYFEFYSHDCYIKDLKTHKVLLQGTKSNGLYKFLLAKLKHAFNTTHEAIRSAESFQKSDLEFQFTCWHQRLGHPFFAIVYQILKSFNIRIPKTKSFSLCHACEMGKRHKLQFSSSTTVYATPLDLIVVDL